MTDRTPASPVEDGRVCGFEFPRTGGPALVCNADAGHPVHRNAWTGPESNHEFQPYERRHRRDRRAALQAQDHTITKGGREWTLQEDAYVIDESDGTMDMLLSGTTVRCVDRAALEPTHD